MTSGLHKLAPEVAPQPLPAPAPADTSATESTGIRKLIKQTVDLLMPGSMVAWRCKTPRNELSLTFDDGPHPAYTPEALAILRRYGAKATFFLVGERAEAHPRLVQQIAADGHEIGNHSYHHVRFATLTLGEARNEIRRAEQAIRMTGVPYSRLFRPPYGKFIHQALLAGWQTRHTVWFWNVDLKDYRAGNAKEICDLMAPVNFSPGDVVLYHATNAAALAALPTVIEKMQSRAGRLVSIGELAARHKRPSVANSASAS
jgi:peptidoglycan/xylan/chitin deacetylase (PgdA/CDA1 family)